MNSSKPITATQMPNIEEPAVPRKAIILLIILTLVWGTNWPLFKYATQEISVWTFRSIALLISGSTLLLIAHLQRKSLAISKEHWLRIGAATFFYLILWNITSTYAAILIPSGQAAILGFTMPLWTALITVFLLGQKISLRLIAAMTLGTISVGLLMSKGLGAYANAPLGFTLGIISGLGWAIGTVILKQKVIDVPAIVLTGWQLLFTAIPLGIGALILGDYQWFMPSSQTILIVTYIALVPMCIGNLCWFLIVTMLPTNTSGISSIMVPMVAMLAGAALNQEPLGVTQWLAMLLCGGALALAIFKPRLSP
jgi:drug/metabolite transporter (DMT)-like permease